MLSEEELEHRMDKEIELIENDESMSESEKSSAINEIYEEGRDILNSL